MLLIATFAIEGCVVIGGVVLFAAWLRRRLDTRWSTWLWGAASFVLSQVLRMPFLIALTALLPAIGFKPDPQSAFWFNVFVLCLTAGLFEETSRYVILRFLAKNARGWSSAVVFGAGHGGAEAILIIVPTVISNIVLLVAGDAILAQTRAVSPQQAAQITAALSTLHNTHWWLALVAIWERVMAITIHIAATILMMQAIMSISRRPVLWWGSAVLFHAFTDAAALIGLRFGGTFGAEFGTAMFFIVGLLIIFSFRRRWLKSTAEQKPALDTA